MEKAPGKMMSVILHILQDSSTPLGSTIIARRLQEYGYDMSQRSIRYYLQRMDRDGLTCNAGKRGRLLTPQGALEIKSAFAIDKVGFIASTIDTQAYKMSFALQKQTGTIILNLTTISKQHFYKAFQHIRLVFQAGLGMGSSLVIGYPGSMLSTIPVPLDATAIGTICSVTINGILMKEGIATTSRFGGLLELSHNKPLRFVEIIHYDGTTIDPLEIFIKGGMTSVHDVLQTGNGRIGASFREFPSVALPRVEKIKTRLDRIGLGGILMIGKPGRPLLDIPVQDGRAGMIVTGGLNPLAAVEEVGIPTRNTAMKLLFDFQKMVPYADVKI
jgi:HTH-type transcriptional regulator, global nitrogen regulator NrpRI